MCTHTNRSNLKKEIEQLLLLKKGQGVSSVSLLPVHLVKKNMKHARKATTACIDLVPSRHRIFQRSFKEKIKIVQFIKANTSKHFS